MIDRINNIKKKYKRDYPKDIITKNNDTHPVKINNGILIEKERNINLLAKCQVLVVGGGPAGLSAALAADRAGADVILVERYGCFGGVITTVGMETLAWYRYEGTIDCEGIGIEMERIAKSMGGTINWAYNNSQCLDADYFKIVADKLILESNIRPLLHCLATNVIMENNIIKGIIVESKSGRQAIISDITIDCTGDADIAYLSGARFRKTNVKDSLAVTTVFGCSGVDKQKFKNYTDKKKATYADWGDDWNQNTNENNKNLLSPYLGEEFSKAKDEGIVSENANTFNGSWSSVTDAGEATNLNLVHMHGYDCTDVNDLTMAEMEGRAQTMEAIKALKCVVPGFENAKLRTFGMTLGTRDSRKIIGKYCLTKNDVMDEARFTDSIGIFPEFIDGYSILTLPTSGRYFQIPYGCIVSDVDNLLVAGRCCAGDRISHAAMRNMMACTVTGQGAGVAASIAVKTKTSTHNVDIKKVQEELIKQKVRIW